MRALVAAIAAILALLAPAGARAAQPLRSDDDAIARASAVPTVRQQLSGTVRADAGRTGGSWIVVFSTGGKARAVVTLDAADGRATAVFTGVQAQYPLARGSASGVGQRKINSLWAWLPLTAVFLLAFFDWRRPFRLLHLDLAVIASLGVSYAFFLDGRIRTSVPLTYPPLIYMALRALAAGFWPRARLGPVSRFSPRLLTVVALVLLAARIVLGLADGHVLDVGYASAAGADRILHGHEIYGGSAHFDTYGPVTYFAYIPFVLIFGFHAGELVPAASQAAAIAFELATVGGLFVLGRRADAAAGRAGRAAALGPALALAWVTCPFTGLALTGSSNDALLSALVVWTFVALRSAPVSGALLGLAGAAKFMPFLIAPLLARGRWLVFGLAMVGVAVLSALVLLPPGGVRQFYDATVGFQLNRFSPFSIWNQHASLEWLQTLVKLVAIGLALAVAFVPRGQLALGRIAALAAAVLITAQLPLEFWFYLYVLWFLPLYCLALFSEHVADERSASSQP